MAAKPGTDATIYAEHQGNTIMISTAPPTAGLGAIRAEVCKIAAELGFSVSLMGFARRSGRAAESNGDDAGPDPWTGLAPGRPAVNYAEQAELIGAPDDDTPAPLGIEVVRPIAAVFIVRTAHDGSASRSRFTITSVLKLRDGRFRAFLTGAPAPSGFAPKTIDAYTSAYKNRILKKAARRDLLLKAQAFAAIHGRTVREVASFPPSSMFFEDLLLLFRTANNDALFEELDSHPIRMPKFPNATVLKLPSVAVLFKKDGPHSGTLTIPNIETFTESTFSNFLSGKKGFF